MRCCKVFVSELGEKGLHYLLRDRNAVPFFVTAAMQLLYRAAQCTGQLNAATHCNRVARQLNSEGQK
jgi:hypothetical protein